MTHKSLIMVQWWIIFGAFLLLAIGRSNETTYIAVGIAVCAEIVTLLTIRSMKRGLARQGKKVSKNPFALP